MVPGYVPFALLLALETASVLIVARRRPSESGALLLCSRCARLQARTETFGRAADAIAVGALAFLVALPFVAAGYESGFTPLDTLLAISAVAAVLAAAAEAYVLVRAVAARIWPHFAWNAEPARSAGGGARWLGAVFALYLFEPRDAGISGLFGGIGARLVADLGSTWTITAAAVVLTVALLVALLARWVVPVLFGSLPAAFAAAREPHGSAK